MKRGKIKTVTEMDIDKRLAILHFDTSFYWSVTQMDWERKWGKEVREMSEEQKKLAAEIAEAVNKVDPRSSDVGIAYLRGMADAARVLQRETA